MHHHTVALRPNATYWRVLRGCLALCAVLGVAGCASAGADTEAALQQQITATIGQAPCTTDAQCRTIGIGAKPCGGPAAWRAWSTQNNPKSEALQSLVDQQAALQRQRQAQAGMVSTCRYLPDPGAVCQAKRCVLKTSADAAS